MIELNKKYADIVRSRPEENFASGAALQEYIQHSTAIYHGAPVECLYMPKLFSPEAYSMLSAAMDTLYGIFYKVMNNYWDSPEYRRLFGFSPELERLILTRAGYPQLIPMARIDLFLNEDDLSFQFCEFNADGASAMNEDREICRAVRLTDACREMSKEYSLLSFELFDSWVEQFCDVYADYCGQPGQSFRVVIADFMESATPYEFIEFRKAFLRAGVECEICEIRELEYEGGRLITPDGRAVDAVYRRAVTRDVMAHLGEVQPFIRAVEAGAVCLVGHFRTQIIHDKIIFKVLRSPETMRLLTGEERRFIEEHVPDTRPLTARENLEALVQDKDRWLIKPEDLYGSRGVFAGRDYDAEAWRALLNEHADKGYLLQRFCLPYRSENLDFTSETRPEIRTYNNLTGLFVYNGRLAGFLSRASENDIITSSSDSRSLASFLAVRKSKS